VARAIRLVAEDGTDGRAYNVGDRRAATLEETVEQWVADGVLYEKKTKHTEGVVEFNKEFTEKPELKTALDIHGTDTETFMRTAHTDTEYVFIFEPGTSDEATALLSRIIAPGGILPAEAATDGYLETRYDRQTGLATTVTLEMTLDGGEVFPELERTVEEDFVAYDESVSVTVPDDVKENAN